MTQYTVYAIKNGSIECQAPVDADSEADAKERFLSDVRDAAGTYEVVDVRLPHETKFDWQ